MIPTLETIDIQATAKQVHESAANPVSLRQIQDALFAFVREAKWRAEKYRDCGWGIVVNQSCFGITTSPYVEGGEMLLAWSRPKDEQEDEEEARSIYEAQMDAEEAEETE